MGRIEIVKNYGGGHAFGWSQDASDFSGLKNVVRIFDGESEFHRTLKDVMIPNLVKDTDVSGRLVAAMTSYPVTIGYRELVGSHTSPRAKSPCDGIVQAAVKGQRREYISDWAADSFVSWAHLCGFISYRFDETDTFEITEEGLAYSRTADGSEEEREILVTALLRYPPVARILGLLSDGEVYTKFELGAKLGFRGEDGFTSLPQNVLLSALAETEDPAEKNKMKSDWDGTSDKYARQICSWLSKLGLVRKTEKTFDVQSGGTTHTETVGQAYQITPDGLKAYRRTRGINKVKREPKNVFWEMLCTKGRDRDYIRTRRAYIIKFLSDSASPLTADKIVEKLSEHGIVESPETIKDDVKGLVNLGLFVDSTQSGYLMAETVEGLVIPDTDVAESPKSKATQIKDRCREYMKCVPHDYLDLVDLAFNSKSNRMFEMKVIELFVSQCGYGGRHLGGARRPDGVIYTECLPNNYGIIVDTKAYEGGYSLPMNQADEMQRYITENLTRSEQFNPNRWWTSFPEDIKDFSYMFVAGEFVGGYEERLRYISGLTKTPGCALSVENLLYTAEDVKSGKISLERVREKLIANVTAHPQSEGED